MTAADLLAEVRGCTICAAVLPLGPRPVLQFDPGARILIAGQAPGIKVHTSGVPYTDASGDRLRQWLGVSPEEFYDPAVIAILPMGMCYPGRGPSGDLPPRPECAPAWRSRLVAELTDVRLTLVIGQYAMAYHLPQARGTLTSTVLGWREHWPDVVPLPHPSPRNNIWLAKNPWFEAQLVPVLQERVQGVLGQVSPS